MAFSFLVYFVSFWRYLRFCIISDDIIGGSTKTAQHSIENNSRNIIIIIIYTNVNHKRNRMTPTMLLPWQHSWLQSFCEKPNRGYSHLQPFKLGKRVLLGTHMVPILS